MASLTAVSTEKHMDYIYLGVLLMRVLLRSKR